MHTDKAAGDHLHRVFTENFIVRDIAEALVSFDATAPADDVKRLMVQRRYKVVGVRQEGLVTGFLQEEELAEGVCGDYLHPIPAADIVDEWASFPAAIDLLCDRQRLFVTGFGSVSGIVTRTDLQKPPVRMWLFGMVTIIEMGFNQLIETEFPDESWQASVSPGRLEKATSLLEERARRNQDLDLLDCLQFSDKGQIIVKDARLREQIGMESRRVGEQMIKNLERLRNNLAHSQDIITSDWDSIVALSANVDRVLRI